MALYRHELRQLLGSLLIWSVTLGITVYVMLPIYIKIFTGSEDVNSDNFVGDFLFPLLGTSMKLLITPEGAYAFLNGFYLVVAAAFGMKLGIALITREHENGTMPFLLTKPYGRTKIYVFKLLAAGTVLLGVGLVYFYASWTALSRATEGSFEYGIFARIAISVFILSMFFLALGMFLGAFFTWHLRFPWFFSMMTAFLFYMVGAYARASDRNWLELLSPYYYVDGGRIVATGGFQPEHMGLLLLISGVLFVAGHRVFFMKDL